MEKRLHFGMGLVWFSLTACGASVDAGDSSPITGDDAATGRETGIGIRDGGEAADGGPTATQDAHDDGAGTSSEIDVERYDLTGTFDWSALELDATLRLTLSPKNVAVTSLVLGSTVSVAEVLTAARAPLRFAVDATAGTLTITLSDAARLPDGRTQLDIRYRAPASGNLRAYTPRVGDPSQSPVVYTYSEPLGVASWMPCHNVPADRAIFSAEMRMPTDQVLIANGDKKSDTVQSGVRVMRYETAYTLPPYLMAFAMGDLEAENGAHGSRPLAVWHRRGVPGDYPALLAELDRLMGLYESLLTTPYPFEKYALVLLPDIPGGVEHAGITFQGETFSGQPSLHGDLAVLGHELGHQWFGDLVTVRTWDDLWFKEGMATLLQEEAVRRNEDESLAHTLQGDQWNLTDGASIVDRSLAPGEKYTTGPYDRAAWLLEQIRHHVGEAAFWKTLHDVLLAHRMDSIDTETFIGAFAGALGAPATAAVRRAVAAKKLPSVDLVAEANGTVRATLHDPDGALLEPMDVAWVGSSGARRTQALGLGTPLLLAKAPDEIFVEDPADLHPQWTALSAAATPDVLSRLAGWKVAQLAPFEALAGVHQRAPLEGQLLLPVGVVPATFGAFVPALHAESAKALAVASACLAGSTDGSWSATLGDWLTREPPYAGIAYVATYWGCDSAVSLDTVFSADWAKLEGGLVTATLPEPRVSYLSRFVLPPQRALSVWGPVAKNGYSVRVRRAAAAYLAGLQDRGQTIPVGALPTWRAFFEQLAAGSAVSEVLRPAIAGIASVKGATAAENAGARKTLADVVHRRAARSIHYDAVCTAYLLTAGDAVAWTKWQSLVADAKLSPAALAAVADPSLCGG